MYYVHKIIAKLLRAVNRAAHSVKARTFAGYVNSFSRYKVARRAALIDSLAETAQHQESVQQWAKQRRAEVAEAEEQAAALHADNITRVGNALDQLRLEQL